MGLISRVSSRTYREKIINMTTNSQTRCKLKLIVVGQSGVGKSSLLVRFVDDHFEEASTRPTIECDIKYKQLDVNGVRTTLRLWDTAGSERFRTFSTQHYRNAQGVIFVYDVTNKTSFDDLNSWLEEVEVNCNTPDFVRMLVANKIDRISERVITTEQGRNFARRHSMMFIEASAATAEGVMMAFQEVSQKIIETPGLWEADEESSPFANRSGTANMNQSGDSAGQGGYG